MITKLPDDIDIAKLLQRIECDKSGIKIMQNKSHIERYLIKGLKPAAANILKQDALSIGAELAVNAGTVDCSIDTTDAVLLATPRELSQLIRKEKAQPFGLKQLSSELEKFQNRPQFDRKIMGVLNFNQDSFNPASHTTTDQVINKTYKMIEDGASIIDIGAESTRPRSEPIGETEELKRIKPVIDALYSEKLCDKTTLSIDSFKPAVIKYALDHGFLIVNDITGARDDAVAKLAASYNATLVIMHMQGTPKTMQDSPTYSDVVAEVDSFFASQVAKAKSFGVEKIILDAGIGFGKTLEHNLELIRGYAHFTHFDYELMIGASRKAMIDKIFPSAVSDRLAGTLAIHQKAYEYGANIIRAHDVYEHSQAFAILDQINNLA